MSETGTELQELLEAEGVADGVDDLLTWARARAQELVAGAEHDPELAPLLGKQAPVADAETATSAKKTRKKRKRRETTQPMEPVAAGADAAEEDAPSQEAADAEWKTELPAHPEADEAEIDGAAATDDEPAASTAFGEDEDEDEDQDRDEDEDEDEDQDQDDVIEDIEELDIEELELLDEDDDEDEGEEDADDDEAAVSTPPELPPDLPPEPPAEGTAEPAGEAPTFGPPDGTDTVPAWKAALFSAQTGDDTAAAQRVEEESGLKPLPEAPDEPAITKRLESEEEEISQHSIDLSDLDVPEDD